MRRYNKLLRYLDLCLVFIIEDLECFYKNLFYNEKYLNRNGVEVVIIYQQDHQPFNINQFVKAFPLINWRIVEVHTDRESFFRFASLNLSRLTSKKFVLFALSSYIFETDVILKLRYLAEYYPYHFFNGCIQLSILNDSKKPTGNILLEYGSLLFETKYLEHLAALSLDYDIPNGNIRKLLQLIGLQKLTDPYSIMKRGDDAKCCNMYDKSSDLGKSQLIPQSKRSIQIKLDTLRGDCGRERAEVYLQRFNKFYYDSESFESELKIIALIQCYNEQSNIRVLLDHLGTHCDAIIMLDDGSIDATYEEAQHPKLILKLRKERVVFDDLENRNILLDCLSFFKSEWAFFIDADERFHPSYCNLYKISEEAPSSTQVISFWVVNTWNSPDFYRLDIPDSNPMSKEGFWCRARMFRSGRGRLQITLTDDRRLHFPAVPYGKAATFPARVVLIHHGMQSKAQRTKKYEFYRENDSRFESNKVMHYDYLIQENPVLQSLELLILPRCEENHKSENTS